MKKNFGLVDYFRIYKARGLLFPLQYFFQNHLYDILNGTDTHFRLDRDQYISRPDGFEAGIWYVSCKTNEVKRSLKIIQRVLGEDFYNYQFVDLGCGKGKSLLIYGRLYHDRTRYKAIGVEYYEPLIEIAKENIEKLELNSMCEVYYDNARNFTKYMNSNKYLLFLYNPFDCEVLDNVLSSVLVNNVCIIYIDPVCDRLVKERGFNSIYSKRGCFPNSNVNIYVKNAPVSKIPTF